MGVEENGNVLPGGSESEYVNRIIKECGYVNPEIEIVAGSQKGDNYLGKIHKITVKDQRTQKEPLNLILKCSTRVPAFREMAQIPKVFEREMFVYREILPLFDKMTEDKNVPDLFKSYPKLYGGCHEEMDEYLIMNDKKSEGFEMKNRKQTLDFEHCKIVLKELAKFHAMSFALKKQQPEVFEKLVSNVDDILFQNDINNTFKNQFQKMSERALKTLDPTKNQLEYTRFSKYADNFYESLLELCNVDAFDEYSVIVHGDCWSNNILYKYGNSNEPQIPTEVCFLDWQLTRYASPAVDISYFIYNCTGSELRKLHFDDLMDTYYSSLEETLLRLDCDPQTIFPREKLNEHLKKYSRFGLFMACFLINLFVSEQDEIPDFDTMKEFSESEISKWDYESTNSDLYNERVGGIIRDAVAQDFI